MFVVHRTDGRIELRDERFAHFLPLLGGLLASVGGKALSWVGEKVGGLLGGAASAVGNLISPTVTAAKEAAVAAIAPAIEATKEKVAESISALNPDEGFGEEEGGWDEEEYSEEEAGEAFDYYYDAAKNSVVIEGPLVRAMPPRMRSAFARHIGQNLHDALTVVRDSNFQSQYNYGLVHDRYAHKFRLGKRLKKLGKKLGKIIKKVGPLASLIPGVGTLVGGALAAVGTLASSKKKGVAGALEAVSSLSPTIAAAVEPARSVLSSALKVVPPSIESVIKSVAPETAKAIEAVKAGVATNVISAPTPAPIMGPEAPPTPTPEQIAQRAAEATMERMRSMWFGAPSAPPPVQGPVYQPEPAPSYGYGPAVEAIPQFDPGSFRSTGYEQPEPEPVYPEEWGQTPGVESAETERSTRMVENARAWAASNSEEEKQRLLAEQFQNMMPSFFGMHSRDGRSPVVFDGTTGLATGGPAALRESRQVHRRARAILSAKRDVR